MDSLSAWNPLNANPNSGHFKMHIVLHRSILVTASLGFLLLFTASFAYAELPDDVIGSWRQQTQECSAATPPPKTNLDILEFKTSVLEFTLPSGVHHKIDYELFKDDDRWIIDMYPQYGPELGRLFPSRISLHEGELTLMMPLDSRAMRRRPKKLQADGNPDWVVFTFKRESEEN